MIPDRPKEFRNMFVRRIALISDMHVGTHYALAPEGFVLPSTQNPIALNEGQKTLLGYWNNWLQVMDDWEVDTVLCLGDMIDGQNYKEMGVRHHTTDLNEQTSMLEVLIKPAVRDRKHYWIRGSNYHVSIRGGNYEQSIAEKLGGVYLGAVALLKIDPFDQIWLVSHGSSQGVIYKEMISGREIMFARSAQATTKVPKVDMIIHGHWHWFNHMHQSNVHHIQCPCWETYYPWPAMIQWYFKHQPDIGAVLVLIDEEGRKTIWPFLYPLPHIADKVISV